MFLLRKMLISYQMKSLVIQCRCNTRRRRCFNQWQKYNAFTQCRGLKITEKSSICCIFVSWCIFHCKYSWKMIESLWLWQTSKMFGKLFNKLHFSQNILFRWFHFRMKTKKKHQKQLQKNTKLPRIVLFVVVSFMRFVAFIFVVDFSSCTIIFCVCFTSVVGAFITFVFCRTIPIYFSRCSRFDSGCKRSAH